MALKRETTAGFRLKSPGICAYYNDLQLHVQCQACFLISTSIGTRVERVTGFDTAGVRGLHLYSHTGRVVVLCRQRHDAHQGYATSTSLGIIAAFVGTVLGAIACWSRMHALACIKRSSSLPWTVWRYSRAGHAPSPASSRAARG
jgi:hypothetical protein